MPNIAKLKDILQQLDVKKVKLVAVSKTKPMSAIEAIYKTGHKIFGENKVQELVDKYEALPKDIEWHLIGHLQTNKVKYIAPFVHLIHAVDSLKLLKIINKEAKKHNRTIDCLLQLHIAQESSKFGLSEQELKQLLNHDAYSELQNVRIVGLMGMATFTNNTQQVRAEFQGLKRIFDETRITYFDNQAHFKEMSMGMSGDYEIAVEEGSTMVRVGSLIFGYR